MIFKRNSGHKTTDRIVRAIIRMRYNDTCQLCKRRYNTRLADYYPKRYFNRIEIDHIIPLARGGRNHIDNYQLTCKECNREKGMRILEER